LSAALVVLAHREPYETVETPTGSIQRRKTNGVFATLDALLREHRGTWVAWRASDDAAGFTHRVTTPEEHGRPGYTVRRIPLTTADAERFYYDFTSTAIWPVLFSLLDRARFTQEAWATYREVNARFAEAACEEAAHGGHVMVNDFHLMLVPELIKQRRPDITVSLFLHTAFPPPDIFAVIPWREELLTGLLHLDQIGFHVPSYVLNFANTAERFMGATPGGVADTAMVAHGPAVSVARYPRHVRWRGRTIRLGAFPVGIDAEYFDTQAREPATRARAEEIRQATGARTVLLSAERLDYVKGALERLECFERFLHRHPDRAGEVAFVQIAVPTRSGMDEFQKMRELTEAAVGRINGRFGSMGAQPVHHFYTSFSIDELIPFYCAADVVWVTPLRDGLNLVTKEYIATRTDETGVVILSEFAGAAAELAEVVLTNPYSPDDMDRALESALMMSPDEQRHRMTALRARVMEFDVHRWAREFLGAAGALPG
jgi:glucosylglycerol-phosphate synthase